MIIDEVRDLKGSKIFANYQTYFEDYINLKSSNIVKQNNPENGDKS